MADVTIKQDGRWILVDSPLGENSMIGTRFVANESISRLFEYELDFISKLTIKPEDLLGKDVAVQLKTTDGMRVFHGRVVRLSAGPMWMYGYRNYRVELAPWTWFLLRTADCRIFEDKKVPDIIEAIFGDLGFSDYDLSGVDKGKHPKREYCVQYRETDFNFVSRLMEEEGIFYFFKHERGKHTMVLADRVSAYLDAKDKQVRFRASQDERKAISTWERGDAYRSGKYAHRDYNFKTPSDKLNTNKNTLLNIPQSTKYEVYDFPGLYFNKGDGDQVTTWRMEAEEAGYEIAAGESDCHSFSPGYKFTMAKHSCKDEEGKSWLILSAQHTATDYTHVAGEGGGAPEYSNRFTAMPDTRIYRPPRNAPKPVVHGPHVAFVTGPSGEEIHTDEYGRIRVNFPWEREGKASCWSRVAQSWAGKKWGTQFIPRIGMEVIVEFLEGDPDRPLVTGCVYNADYMPTYALPDNKTQSGWKTRSTTGGGDSNFNELRFEDKKDSEEVYFHAEKDFNRVVENNDTLKVGFDKKDSGDQTIEIFNNQTVKVGTAQASDGSQTIEIYKDRTQTLKTGNETLKVQMGNQSTTLSMGNQSTKLDLGASTHEAMQSIELKVGQSSVTVDQTGVTIKGMMITIEGQVMTQVKGAMTQVTGSAMLQLSGGIVMIG